MRNYRITNKGKLVLALIILSAIICMIRGGIYTAVFVFIISLVALIISIYEIFFNKN